MRTAGRYYPLFLAGALLLAVAGTACADKAAAPGDSPITPAADALSVGIVVPEDGTVLSGNLFGDENEVLVILSHMRPNDQTAWFPFARELAENGYAALTFDFRGYGASGGDQDFEKLDEDLAAAIRYMRALDREQLFLLGASMGGTTSLVVAAQQSMSGVVAVSAPAEFQGQAALPAISDVAAPTLLIASEDDAAARVSLQELLDRAGSNVASQTYTGGAHGTSLFEGEHAAAIRKQILRFLAEHSDS